MRTSDLSRAIAYTRWRWASVYLANTLVNRLADAGRDIIVGTTGTSAATVALYAAAKNAGYETHALICHAPQDVRLASVAERFKVERRFIPDQDVLHKGNTLFPAIVADHIAAADNAAIYWRSALNSDAVLAAEVSKGRVTVHDAKALADFIGEIKNNNPAFDWDQAVRKSATAVKPEKTPALTLGK